jgi:hypothetical protein
MPIEINPNLLNIASSATSKTTERRRPQATSNKSAFRPPSRADLNYIPSVESLFTLINSAVEALRNGVYWDRGTILNVVV